MSGREPLNFLLQTFRPYRKEIFNIYIIALIYGLLSLSLPLGVQSIINLIMAGSVSTSWILLVVLILLGLAATSALQIFQYYLVENIRQSIYLNLTFDLASIIPKWKMEKLQGFYNPELVNRYFDIINLQKNITKILIDFSLALFRITFGLLLLSLYHSLFIGLTILITLFIFILLYVTHKRALQTSIIESKYKYQTAYWLQEMARGIEIFKLAKHKFFGIRKTDEISINYLEYRKQHFGVLITQFFWLSGFKIFALGFLLIFGGLLVMNQQMNIGQFVAAEIIIVIMIGSIQDLVKSFEYVYDVLTSSKKIHELHEIPQEEMKKSEFVPSTQTHGIKVELKNLSYKFLDKSQYSIQDVNAIFPSGSKILIHADHSGGKTLFSYLIGTFYHNYEGTIYFDDKPLNHLNLISVRKYVSETVSKSEVIYDTFLNNITLGRDIPENEVMMICDKLELSRVINTLPDGLYTQLNAEDKRLSKSVRQRIKIARALVGKPRLILFNEDIPNIAKPERKKIIEMVLSKDNPATVIAISTLMVYKELYDQCFTLTNQTLVPID